MLNRNRQCANASGPGRVVGLQLSICRPLVDTNRPFAGERCPSVCKDGRSTSSGTTVLAASAAQGPIFLRLAAPPQMATSHRAPLHTNRHVPSGEPMASVPESAAPPGVVAGASSQLWRASSGVSFPAALQPHAPNAHQMRTNPRNESDHARTNAEEDDCRPARGH